MQFLLLATLLSGIWLAQAAPTTSISDLSERAAIDRRFYLIPSLPYPQGFNKASCPLTNNLFVGGRFATDKGKRSVATIPPSLDTSKLVPRASACQVVGSILFEKLGNAQQQTINVPIKHGKRYVFSVNTDANVRSLTALPSSAFFPTLAGTTTGKITTVRYKLSGLSADEVPNPTVAFKIQFQKAGASGYAVLFELD